MTIQPEIRKPVFSRRNHYSIAIIKNGYSWQYSINPAYCSILAGLILLLVSTYITATAYLFLRDGLITSQETYTFAKQQEYEERILALRSNLDTIKSKQLVTQQAIKNQLMELLEQQRKLGSWDSTMQSIVKKAYSVGLDIPELKTNQKETASNRSKQNHKQEESTDKNILDAGEHETALLASIGKSQYKRIHANQKQVAVSLYQVVQNHLDRVNQAMNDIDVKPNHTLAKTNLPSGGPFESLNQEDRFSAYLEHLDNSLLALKGAYKQANSLPLDNPIPKTTPFNISSHFGPRLDPFRHTSAMHSGLDLAAPLGTPVLATGNGTVLFAGKKTGYGKMIEIDHGDGRTTRYAHLSSILVKAKQKIKVGTVIGKVGNTGRSTGPHLHYEVRIYGTAINPQKYLQAGHRLAHLTPQVHKKQ